MLIVSVILITIILIICLGDDGWVRKTNSDYYYPNPYQHVIILYKLNQKDVTAHAVYCPNNKWIIDNTEIDDNMIIAWRLKSC